jgi:DNA-binding CsgD family transcriptional regulator
LCRYEDRRIFETVSALRQSDLGAVLDFLGDAEAVTGPVAFTPELVGRLGELVACDLGPIFCELDRPRKRLIGATSLDGRFEDIDDDDETDAYWRLRHQHPACWYHERTGDFSARKVSDFVTLRELRRREIWEQRFRDWPYELTVGLPAPPWHTKVFLFHRKDRDFRARDRRVLDVLRPHFVHLWESAKARKLAAALAAGAEAPGELVLFDGARSIEFATGAARRLLEAYFDEARGARLPTALEEWVRHASRKPLTVERGQRQLVVMRLKDEVDGLLLTEEPIPATGSRLSYREWQVLELVEEGKSNAEVAAALWISPATVRTHLENIFGKLGVRSRTAAVARARELRRAETA